MQAHKAQVLLPSQQNHCAHVQSKSLLMTASNLKVSGICPALRGLDKDTTITYLCRRITAAACCNCPHRRMSAWPSPRMPLGYGTPHCLSLSVLGEGRAPQAGRLAPSR